MRAVGTTLRDWVEAEAGATQTPPALTAVVALATLSACESKKFEVESPLAEHGALVGEPGAS